MINFTLSGRQSPSVQKKVQAKVTSSPIVRRVRKSESSKSLLSVNMRKSVSMDSVPSASCQSLLGIVVTDLSEDNTGELHHQTDQIFDQPPANIEGNVNGNLSASYSTLPLPQSFSRGKNISRSLVPKMRKFFEKSRSCDPELPQVKIRIQREPNSGTGRGFGLEADGTESARSSFVLLAPGEGGAAASTFSGSTITLEEGSEGRGEEVRARQLKNNRGFVNKCVGKVRSLMGRSEERASEC